MARLCIVQKNIYIEEKELNGILETPVHTEFTQGKKIKHLNVTFFHPWLCRNEDEFHEKHVP